MSDLAKAEIISTSIELSSTGVNIQAETNRELTEKLRALGAHPFWYSSHPRKNGDVVFMAFGVTDPKEATNLQWNDRAARIRIGLKP